MPDSNLVPQGGSGEVNQAKLRKLASEWGRLPERERDQILQNLIQGLPPTQREAVENYFRKLTETQ